ncbi:MAG: hypothetical protein H7X97_00555 [Opitutaceae bacterium]|nr:hypothetical protein [Verrucomicrobiales bacterium]
MTSRRKFILQCSAVASVAAVPAVSGLIFSRSLADVSLNEIGFADFTRLIGTHFEVCHDQSTVQLELAEASAGSAAGEVGHEEFSLIFRGRGDQPLGQMCYPFEHGKIGRFVMFIVPVGVPDATTGSRSYQAIFNRPVRSTTPSTRIYG